MNCVILSADLTRNFDWLNFWSAVPMRIQHRRLIRNVKLNGLANFVDKIGYGRNSWFINFLSCRRFWFRIFLTRTIFHE
jgi:hypothetical protein